MSRPYIFLKTILSIIRPGSTGTRKLGSLKRQNNIYGISRGRCFGFARIVGIVGSSNTPVSGMTIAVMLLTTAAFGRLSAVFLSGSLTYLTQILFRFPVMLALILMCGQDAASYLRFPTKDDVPEEENGSL